MTNQEAFDTMARHLLTQMKRSGTAGNCLYRGPNGLKCAVGALIPDSEYKPELEGCAACSIHKYCPSLHGLYRDLLDHVQLVHDRHEPPTWRDELRVVAEAYDLSPAVLDEFQ